MNVVRSLLAAAALTLSLSVFAQSANLSVSKIGPASANAGEDVVYSITVANAGPDPATTAILHDAPPQGTSFVSMTQTSGATTFVCTGTVDCTAATFPAGQTATFDLTLHINGGSGSIDNTATFNSSTFDPDTSDNSSVATVTLPADVAVSKSSPATAAAGSDVAFNIAVTNYGPNAAPNVQLKDILQPGLTFRSGTQTGGPAFTCSYPAVDANGTITCDINTLAAGATATFTFVVRIPAGAAPGTTFSNVAQVSVNPGVDPNDENDAAPASVSVPSNMADVVVVKDGPNGAAAGSNVTYTISVSNVGPADATSVSLTDTLPGNLTFVLLNQSGAAFSCTTPAVGAGGTISCSTATLTNGAATTFTLVASIPAGTPDGTEYSNKATVAATSPDPNSENNVSLTTLTVSSIDVGVVKSGPGSVTAGQNVTYTITVASNGSSAAPFVELTDVLPGGTTLVTFTQDTGTLFNCTTPGAGNNGTIHCSLPSMAAGTSAAFTLVVAVPASVPGGTTLTNTASVSNAAFDTNSNNDVSSVATTVIGVTDLAVAKNGPTSATAGNNITYTMTVTNGGASAAANVTLTDNVPTGTTFVSFTQNSGPTFSCNTAVVCTLASMPAGSSATFTFVVKASSGGAGTTIGNVATVSTTTGDTNGGNNSSSVNTSLSGSADLGVTKSGPASAVRNQNVSYTITVSNAGPSDAASVALSDPLPANATFVSMTQTAGPVFTCTAGTANCSIATLTSGASATFTLVLHSNAGGTGNLSNVATVSSATSDPNGTNNSATANTTLTNSADLAVTKTGPATALQNQDVSYTITVTNAGPSDATGVTLSDPIPPQASFVSITQNGGPTFACNNTVTCTIATFANGATASFTLVVHTNASVTGGMTNTATASSGSSDPNNANNSASAMTNVLSADLAVAKSGPATAVAGNNVSYAITVANNGPAAATNVAMTDAYPGIFVSIAQTAGPTFTCVPSGSFESCTIASLASGASAVFSLTVNLPKSMPPGTATNTATITATSPIDPTPGNNSASASTIVTQVDLSVTKSVSPPPYGTGLPVTWTIVARNNAASAASSVVVTDVLTAGSTLTGATSTQGSCSGTATVTCTLGTMAAGATATITIQANLPATPGAVTNTATISSANGDSNPANDTASSTITVIPAAQIPALDAKSLLLLAAVLSVVAAFMMKRS